MLHLLVQHEPRMHQDYPNPDTRYPWVSWASPTNYTVRKGLKVKMCSDGRGRCGDAMVTIRASWVGLVWVWFGQVCLSQSGLHQNGYGACVLSLVYVDTRLLYVSPCETKIQLFSLLFLLWPSRRECSRVAVRLCFAEASESKIHLISY